MSVETDGDVPIESLLAELWSAAPMPISLTIGEWGYAMADMEMSIKRSRAAGETTVADCLEAILHKMEGQLFPQFGLSSSVEEIRQATRLQD